MRDRRACLLLTLVLAAARMGVAAPAFAQADDLLDDDDSKPKPKEDEGLPTTPAPVATIRGHAYTLAECLALADRNFPNLWAARARLAFVHAQLDEAKWTPFSQWNASSNFSILGPIGGTAVYTATGQNLKNIQFANTQPFFSLDVNGVLPLYTFGKITSIREAAEANVRVSEWDLEKSRQLARMDVRKAYYGVMLARDGRYVLNEVLDQLGKFIRGLERKQATDAAIDETDKLRLQVIREETLARAGEADKGERYGMAVLRFYTGVQTAFDIPDEPLHRPDVVIAPLVRYLAAARIFRPEINMARAGVVARAAQVDYAKAQLFPDIGVGFGASYAIAPSAAPQYQNIWVNDPFNHFYAYAGLGVRWSLDLLPRVARVSQAESQLEETRSLERMALGGIAVEVENAYGVVLETKGREEAWARDEHLTKQWISTVQDAIELGTKDERALTEPLRAYVNARVNHIIALMDFNVALSDLARVSGWDAAAPVN